MMHKGTLRIPWHLCSAGHGSWTATTRSPTNAATLCPKKWFDKQHRHSARPEHTLCLCHRAAKASTISLQPKATYIYTWRFVEKFVPKIGLIAHLLAWRLLLESKNIPRLTIIKSARKNTKASSSLQQCTCAGFFQSDDSEDEVKLLLLHDIAPCFPLPFLHCNALSAFSPPLCGQIPLVFCKLSFQGSDPLFWVSFLTSPNAFFACAGLAHSLRGKCNLISQFWTC